MLNDNINENIKLTRVTDSCINSPYSNRKSELLSLSCETSSLSSRCALSMQETTNNRNNTSLTLSLSSASSSTTTTTNKTNSATNKSLSSSLSSLDSLTNNKIDSLNSNRLQIDTNITAPYYFKKFYGKEWLFKKLHEYVINKIYDKPFFLILIGDSGNGKTHLCCEIKWPTITNDYLFELNKQLISIYFFNLYNLTQNSYSKNLYKLYEHLKNSILKELFLQLNVDSTTTQLKNSTTTTSTRTTTTSNDDDDVEENDDAFLVNDKNEDDDDDDYIINKYATKFNENVICFINKYNQDILKLNKNYYILIDGIDELLLFDQYLSTSSSSQQQHQNNKQTLSATKNFNLIFKFLNKIFLKFPKWLHLIVTSKRLTEKQYIRNRYFNNIKNYFKLSIDMCITLNDTYLNIINEKINENSDLNLSINNTTDTNTNTNIKSNYSLVSYLSQNNNNNNQNNIKNNDKLSSSSSSSSSSTVSSSPSSTASRLSSSSFIHENKLNIKEPVKQQQEHEQQQETNQTTQQQQQQQQTKPQLTSESSAYSTASSSLTNTNNNLIQTNIPTTQQSQKLTSAEILNAAHFASLKDIQIYILKRLDNDNELKLKFNKLNAIEMLNLLLIKSNNCLLYVEKILDLILLNIINSREIRDIPVTIYGLYLFLIERLLIDLNSASIEFVNDKQPSLKQLIYSIFNLFIVELRPINKLKLHSKLKLKYLNLDYNYYEYVFNSIAPILFIKIQNSDSSVEQQQQEYLLFHSSLIEWFSDVKFCTNKYLFNLNEGHFILTLFYFNKFKKQNSLNNEQHNYSKHKKLLKLFKKFQYHLINSYPLFGFIEYKYLLNLCESTSSLLLNYESINGILSNTNNNNNNTNESMISNSSSSYSNNNNNEIYNHVNNNNENFTTTNSNYSIKKLNMCDSGLGLNTEIGFDYQLLLFNFLKYGDINGVKLLISKGVDPELTDSSNQTVLVLAAKLNNFEVIDYLCKIPSINLDHCDNEGWTALRYSSWTGNEIAVKRLLESHASVDACDSEGRTALRAAVYGNHESIMKLLIKYGANINKYDKDGRSILQIACYKGHWNIINFLVKYDSLINHKDYCGRNALFTTIYTQNKSNCIDIMKLLINNGCNINECDNNNQTVLIIAVQEQFIDIVHLLVTHGIDIDAIDSLGYTAIGYAIRNKNAPLVEYLLNNNAATHILDLEGRSILSISCSSKCEEAVKLLMIKGLDEMHKDNYGWTPLHEASYVGSENIVNMLLQYGSDIDDLDNEAKSGLYYACQEGHLEVVKLLVNNNASLVQRSHDGNTPFRIACLQGHKAVCEYLISRIHDINDVDSDGRNTLYCMILLNKNIEMIEFLLKNGAYINQKDTDGRSCLHIAAHVGYIDAISLLIRYNADIESMDNGGRTPLLTASWNDNIPVVRKLLEAGAEINHQDQQGATALSIASQKGGYDLVLELLTHGALIYASSKNPIQLATKCGFHNISKLLENWSITTGQKPSNVPRTSKSLDSFRLHSQNNERRLMATLSSTPIIKKDKLKTSHSISYQCKPNIPLSINLSNTTESYYPSQLKKTSNNQTINCTPSKKPENSFRNIFLKRSNTTAEKNSNYNIKNSKNDKNLSIIISNNHKNSIESSNIVEKISTKSNRNSSIQSTPASSPAPKVKNSNNKFIQMIRKKFKFLKGSGSSNNESNNETKRSMQRSVTDSIAHNKKHTDDAAFIFNRASINEYFNQRSSFKEFNNNEVPSYKSSNKNTPMTNNLNSNYNPISQKQPNSIPLNYFKKETSI